MLAIVGFHLNRTTEEQAAQKNRFVLSIDELQFCQFHWELLTHCCCCFCKKSGWVLSCKHFLDHYTRSQEKHGRSIFCFPVRIGLMIQSRILKLRVLCEGQNNIGTFRMTEFGFCPLLERYTAERGLILLSAWTGYLEEL